MGDEAALVCTNDTSSYFDEEELLCRMPAESPREAVELLETVGTGGALGTGMKLARMGTEIPRIRTDYERQVGALLREVANRQGQVPVEDLARWTSGERVRIARSMRWRQGLGSVVLLEVRDNLKYGLGGRSFPNMERRYAQRGYRGVGLYNKILGGATNPNIELSSVAYKGATYLKQGGRAIFVVSAVTTSHRILTAPKEDLPRVLAEEGGAFAGGALGAEAAVGLCLVFGIATGGWGLLACGVVGGVGGGLLGAEVGNQLYYASSSKVEQEARAEALVNPEDLEKEMPQACF